jgi:hypothetical protein
LKSLLKTWISTSRNAQLNDRIPIVKGLQHENHALASLRLTSLVGAVPPQAVADQQQHGAFGHWPMGRRIDA